MSFGLLDLLMLFGLAGVAIPPLIHLLNRRRYVPDVNSPVRNVR